MNGAADSAVGGPVRRRRRKPGFLDRLLAVDGQRPNPYTWLVLGYAALFQIRPWEWVGGMDILPWERIYALVLIGAVVGLVSTYRSAARLGPATKAWLGLLGAITLSWLVSINMSYGWVKYEQLLKLAIVGVCLVIALRTRADLRIFVLGWIAIQFAYQGLSVFEHEVHGRGVFRMGVWRLMGIDETFSGPNDFASTTTLMLPLVFFALRHERHRLIRLFLMLEVLLAIYVVVKTASRGGFVLVGLFFLFTLVMSRHKAVGLVAVGALAVAAVLFLPDDIVDRYRTIIDPEANAQAQESAEGRIMGLKRGIAIFQQRPILGIGVGCTRVAYTRLSGLPGKDDLELHNVYGQVIAETGGVGAIAWLVFVGVTIRIFLKVRRLGRRLDEPYLADFGRVGLEIMGLLLLSGFLGHNLYRYTWLWIAALGDVALAITLRRQAMMGAARSGPSSARVPG